MVCIKQMEAVGVTDLIHNQDTIKAIWTEKLSKFNTANNEKIFMKYAQSRMYISSMCEQ